MATSDAFEHPASILALAAFRLNGALIAAGDALAVPLGLTSARWQVLGAIAEARGNLPVAGLARNMGLVRQSVQRVADELDALGIVRFAPNPHHRRAKLVQLTPRGETVFATMNERWLAVADAVLADFGDGEAARTAALMRSLRDRLEALRESEAASRAPPEP